MVVVWSYYKKNRNKHGVKNEKNIRCIFNMHFISVFW